MRTLLSERDKKDIDKQKNQAYEAIDNLKKIKEKTKKRKG